MNDFTPCYTCLAPWDCGRVRACLRGPSAEAPSESTGPRGALALATCSLSASEAVALADEWVARSIKCNQRCIEACREGAEDFATANSVRSATYLLCADELRQRMGLPISRQPTENPKISHATHE